MWSVAPGRTGLLLVAALAAACSLAPAARAASRDVAAIRALEDRFAAALEAKDLGAIMKVYAPDRSLLVFDVITPRQYAGAAAYRQDWADFLATFKGSAKFAISDLAITADSTLAYSHSIQHVSGIDTKEKPIDLTVRVTDVYRKMKGQWLIVHEHVSVPIDPKTEKPDMSSRP